MSIAVVTAFTPFYDALQSPAEPQTTGVTHLAWVDTPSVARLPEPWNPRRLPTVSRVGKRRCLYVKTHLNDLVGEHHVIIWIDARLNLTIPASELVERYLTSDVDLVTFRHPRNTTLRDEIDEIRRESLVPASELDFFTRASPDEALDRSPHSETNCIIIRNNEHTRQFGLDWWAAIEGAPARDQLTFDDVLVRSNLISAHFDNGATSADTCDFLEKGRHLARRPRRASPERRHLTRPVLWYRQSHIPEPAGSRPTVSIIVPVHGGHDHVRACLESIIASDFGGELVIVDNGSDEKTARLCQAFAERTSTDIAIILEQTTEPLGFGRAANLGSDYASGDIIIILNSDTVVPKQWSAAAVRAFDEPATFACGYVSNQAGDLSVGREAFDSLVTHGWAPSELTEVCADFARTWSDGLAPEIVRSAHGSAIAFRRSAFTALGGFDTTAFPDGYGEEVDLCLRAMRIGYVNRVSTEVFYHHVGHATYGPRRDGLNQQAKVTLGKRHPTRVLEAISDDLRHTPTVRALDLDLTGYLRQLLAEQPTGQLR